MRGKIHKRKGVKKMSQKILEKDKIEIDFDQTNQVEIEQRVEIIDLDDFELVIINCACKSGEDLPFKR